jgi:uncharacterized protein (TIGR00730 family)
MRRDLRAVTPILRAGPRVCPEFFKEWSLEHENGHGWPIKAYDNKEFLHSAQARTMRLLAEYLEPQARLRQYKVRGTIVMFGSARALSPEELGVALKEAQEQLRTVGNGEGLKIRQRMAAQERMARYYADAERLSFLLTQYYQTLPDSRDRHLVCSGGGPGIMEAANRGAREAGGRSVGLGISLPMEQGANRYLDPRLTFEFHYFFMRKYWFMYLARALVVFPGGFGTMDELFEMMTLIQTRKVKKRLPIILYGARYWEEAIRFDTMIEWGVISAEDVNLFRICDNPEEAFEYLKSEVHLMAATEPPAEVGLD